jgi:hypothetical protein
MKSIPIADILRKIRPLAQMHQAALMTCPVNKLPSQETIKEKLHYDPETGLFRFIGGPRKGKVADCRHPNGYIQIGFGPPWVLFRAHRLAWIYVTGREPEQQIDHIDGDRSNNKWANLREATPRQNSANSKSTIPNTSGYRGVSWDARRNKWFVKIKVSGVQKFLGYYDDPAVGHQVYCAAARELNGDFARFT